METALVCIDFINEMMSEGGKLSGKGYKVFAEKNNTLRNVRQVQELFRKKGYDIIHVKISFSRNYLEHPERSILFGKAKEFGALSEESWGVKFHEHISPVSDEKIIIKRRVSAFYQTDLDLTLKARGIKNIYIAGVSTDLAVESAARDAHDRDYNVNVLEDCCVAGSDDDHKKSIITLAKISNIVTVNDIDKM